MNEAEKIKLILGGSEGKMGKVIQRLASGSEDIFVPVCIDTKFQFGSGKITQCSLPGVDHINNAAYRDLVPDPKHAVYVDFTAPDAVLPNVKRMSEAGYNSLIGTTGWADKLGEMEAIAKQNNVRILWGDNYSAVVNAQFYLAKEAARILGELGYDAGVGELHHIEKGDCPSGTGGRLGSILVENLPGKKEVRTATAGKSKRRPDQVDVGGIRVGSIVGDHTVTFAPSMQDGLTGELELRSRIYTRDDFGRGVLTGARWHYANRGGPAGLFTFYGDVLGLD